MKKIIFTIIILFLFQINTSALTVFNVGSKVSDMRTIEIKDSNRYEEFIWMIVRQDGKITYCINPFLKLNKNGYNYEFDYNDSIFNLTDEKLDKMNLIAYYGYNYENQTEIKWYGITQYLIWKELDLTSIYFVDINTLNKIDVYENEVNEIMSKVNNYYLLPSFYSSNLEFSIDSYNELEDTNNVLSNYNIIDSNIASYINNNKLVINTNESGNYYIKLKRKSPINENYKLYYESGYQELLVPGKVKDIDITLNIKVNSGSIIINKIDSENIKRLSSTLEGAKYNVYYNDELIDTYITDSNGKIFINNLKYGNYTLKEIESSIGYNLDNNTYKVEINGDNLNINITSYEEVIKGEVIINKYYDNNIREDHAMFNIYDSNNNYIDTIITNDGYCNIYLDYGKYTLKQVKGVDGYKYVSDISIDINNNGEYIYNLYDVKEELVVDVPNTYKYSYNYLISNILILNGLILIIYNIFIKKIIK